MAIGSLVSPIMIPQLNPWSALGSTSISAIDIKTTANTGWGFIFSPPKNGNLKKVSFYISSLSSSANVIVAFSKVDTTLGLPNTDPANFVTGSAEVQVNITANGMYVADFSATPASVNVGDYVAVTIRMSNTAPGSFGLTAIGNPGTSPKFSNFPYYVTCDGTTWTTQNQRGPFIFGVGYESNDFIQVQSWQNAYTRNPIVINQTGTGIFYSSYGAVFSPNFDMELAGLGLTNASGTIPKAAYLRVSDITGGANTDLTTTPPYFPGFPFATSGGVTGSGAGFEMYFSPRVTLNAGKKYRIFVTSGTTAANAVYEYVQSANAGLLTSLPMYPNWYLTYSNTSGWFEDANSYPVSLYLLATGFGISGGGGAASVLQPPTLLGGINQ